MAILWLLRTYANCIILEIIMAKQPNNAVNQCVMISSLDTLRTGTNN